jgi:hypothetical protein
VTARADNNEGTRQEARETKLRKKRSRMQQHGKSLAKIYRQVIEKRKKTKKAL